ncbi:MAG: SDR family oxidoreductase [Cyclobacteriaceae bacterium]
MLNFKTTCILIISLLVLSIDPPSVFGQSTSDQKAVLITGATSGIGLKTAQHLASKGHFVYAGARKDADMEMLNEMENVMAVRLDVTKQDQIDAAVETIRNEGRGLWGLVNNAGVAVIAPLAEVPEEDLHFQLNVNVYGVYRVTKAFAPLIIESKGRITTTGSISGILSGFFFGPYSMSKHAIEAFTDALAAEMQPFGVQVSVIEPGNYDSKIGDKVLAKIKSDPEFIENSMYKEQFESLLERWDNGEREKDPQEVAEAFERALFSDKPKRRYMVVPYEGQGNYTIKQAMREMLQLNQGQPYTMDRDELIKLMDEVQVEIEGN